MDASVSFDRGLIIPTAFRVIFADDSTAARSGKPITGSSGYNNEHTS